MRVISYNQGNILGNSVVIQESEFLNTMNEDRSKEIKGRKVHLWYRAGLGSKDISLTVENCFFDATGIITGTVNLDNLSIQNSVIKGEIELNNNNRNYPNPKIKIINNQFPTNSAENAIKSNAHFTTK